MSAHRVEFNNSGNGKMLVPGFGLPVHTELGRYTPYPDSQRIQQFEHGASGQFLPDRLTVREVAMIQFMEAVTDKSEWSRKVFDEEIVAKWGKEAAVSSKGLMSEKALEWCITELRERAADFDADGLVRTLESGSRCVKSDSAIPTTLRDELREAIRPLLEVPDASKDWHPKSDEQVLNLVHPSMFPLVYGRTPVLPEGLVPLETAPSYFGCGSVPPVEQAKATSYDHNSSLWSMKFQWLPAEVKFQGDTGIAVRVTSYINNLHPAKNRKLYSVIERFIERSIPAWNEVLMKEDGRVDARIETQGVESDEPHDALPDWYYDADKGRWYDVPPIDDEEKRKQVLQKLQDYLQQPDHPSFLECDAEEFPKARDYGPIEDWTDKYLIERAIRWKARRMRKVLHPEPGQSCSYDQWKSGGPRKPVVESRYGYRSNEEPRTGLARDSYKVVLEDQFRKQGLQIIVKLASIELNSQKPAYPGGSWHLEGMLNEHIVGTAIYYYDVENCTPSRLRFRQQNDSDEEFDYEQSDHGPLERVFGTCFTDGEQAVQEIGSIDTREGRLLVFPNTLQHKVDPFELIDATKPGHRRFLVLWLVDPHYRILSTANVPPQQFSWWREHVRPGDWNRDLPAELRTMILDHSEEGTMSLEEAKELRLELMNERTTFAEAVEEDIGGYNLCEH